MWRYIRRRLLEMIPTTLGVLILSFLLFYVVGGSPAQMALGPRATQAELAAYDAAGGYDLPLFFGNWYTIDAIQTQAGTPNLAYDLRQGEYRISGAPTVEIKNALTQTTETRTTEAPILVKEGQVITSAPGVTCVERHTQHFFDSQFVNYLKNLICLDLGDSREKREPVIDVLVGGWGPTMTLSIPILLFGSICGVVLGLLCAASQGGILDRGILVVSTLLMSVNYVVWILLGQFLLGFHWPIFPIWGYESAYYLVLPVVIGVISSLGSDVRFYRAAILDEIYKPYVRTAIAKGIAPARILFVHVLRNALIPIVTYISLSIPYLFTGSLLLESFFGIPGVGAVSLDAINSSDMSVVRAVVIFGALIYQSVNLLTDILYGYLDPRVRLAE